MKNQKQPSEIYCINCYRKLANSEKDKKKGYCCKDCGEKFNHKQAKSLSEHIQDTKNISSLESGACPKCKTELEFGIEHRLLKNGTDIECPECKNVFNIKEVVNYSKDTLKQSLYAFLWGFPIPILGVIFGAIAVNDIKKTKGDGKILAIFAIVLPILRMYLGNPYIRQPFSDVSTIYDILIFDIIILVAFLLLFLHAFKTEVEQKGEKIKIIVLTVIIITAMIIGLGAQREEKEQREYHRDMIIEHLLK